MIRKKERVHGHVVTRQAWEHLLQKAPNEATHHGVTVTIGRAMSVPTGRLAQIGRPQSATPSPVAVCLGLTGGWQGGRI